MGTGLPDDKFNMKSRVVPIVNRNPDEKSKQTKNAFQIKSVMDQILELKFYGRYFKVQGIFFFSHK